MDVPLRLPRIRRAPIPDDAVLVVRGDDLDPATARQQAETFRRRFPDWGRYGLSAYHARSEDEIDDLAADQLERFPLLALFRRTDLEAAGFETVPTFRTPHVTIAFTGEPDERLRVLDTLRVVVRPNPYHDPEPASDHERGRTR
jgi:hypothetical protein